MSAPDAILSVVTLGVSDLERSIAFYEALGFRHKATKAEGVCCFQAGVMNFALWPAGELARDSSTPASDAPAFRGVALARNCRADVEVDAAIERARRAGGSVPKPPRKTHWGGYAGYFVDPDGYLWEVAHNPHWPLTAD